MSMHSLLGFLIERVLGLGLIIVYLSVYLDSFSAYLGLFWIYIPFASALLPTYYPMS